MKAIVLLVIAALTLNVNGFAVQGSPLVEKPETQSKEDSRAVKAKAEVQKRGIGEHSRVRVSLRNGTELKGYISKIGEDSFEITERKSGAVRPLSYNDVNKVKGPGSKALEIAAITGIGVAVVSLLAVSNALGLHD